MFSSLDLIEAVDARGRLRRRLSTGQVTAPGEFPPAWRAWLKSAGERAGAVRGVPADTFLAILAAREPAPAPRPSGELNRWQAFAILWRQQWTPPDAEDRRVRWVAIVLTAIIHLGLLTVLFWLASVRFVAASAPEGDEIVQVEYVGTGTPVTPGAAAAAAAPPAVQPVAKPMPAPASKPASVATPSKQAAKSPTALEPVSPPPTPERQPPRPQPLQVTEVSVPTQAFALPPPTERPVALPDAKLAIPHIQAPLRAVQLIEPDPVANAPAPAPVQAKPAPRPTGIPTVVQPMQAPVVAIAPARPAQLVPPPATQPAPTVAPPAQPTPAAAPATAPSQSAPIAPAAVQSSGAAKPATASGANAPQVAQGHGEFARSTPGAHQTPQRGDDWGAALRNRPGGDSGTRPGLFNPDGTPRVASQPGGFPPGSDHWTRDQFDRAGSWLKRRPNDFTPTQFDKLWVPSETLLEEWVRKNIRDVSIPIPGTSKSLHCVVSLLQLGGGCGITDANMNDQEAEARPPPDVPFKPDLQQDQGSLARPGKP